MAHCFFRGEKNRHFSPDAAGIARNTGESTGKFYLFLALGDREVSRSAHLAQPPYPTGPVLSILTPRPGELKNGAGQAARRGQSREKGTLAGWLVALLVTIDPKTPVSVPLLAVFVLLECGRVWVIATLGSRWTTRIMVVPGAKRIRTGPYRYLNHPNYLIVCGEIAVVPLMFGAWGLAAIASVLNLLALRTRIRIENQALAEVYGEVQTEVAAMERR